MGLIYHKNSSGVNFNLSNSSKHQMTVYQYRYINISVCDDQTTRWALVISNIHATSKKETKLSTKWWALRLPLWHFLISVAVASQPSIKLVGCFFPFLEILPPFLPFAFCLIASHFQTTYEYAWWSTASFFFTCACNINFLFSSSTRRLATSYDNVHVFINGSLWSSPVAMEIHILVMKFRLI